MKCTLIFNARSSPKVLLNFQELQLFTPIFLLLYPTVFSLSSFLYMSAHSVILASAGSGLLRGDTMLQAKQADKAPVA